MHNLIYLSSASYLYSEDELIEILNKSRVNNARVNVTGLLLYHEGSILQILEGEKETVNNLYLKISKDVRHKAIMKMIEGSIQERSFSDWSMGFKQLSNEEWLQIEGHIDLRKKEAILNITNQGTTAIINMIKSFGYVNQLR